ncbi:hypothetical protein Pmar_PMAR001572 [Perkinsus marinus ATCC 50983]|uniref:Uncharacterized protein n=1 Tax=Perkinsus marinus (strain ATCC 50983 / TXsc) TaxID=423536 RepID=C5L9S5_PERM5|nr:hypothetical protein Pmar_PMAR001572 [Perkinsus marinus ATCC 50983]EER06518.1 hypothetical protein Pmar_PMAR001572 [Perkinsus marinus ATCC 50983]|eukprot:XP_002774702.1 hypothetical protein Pmar_PMAR001572 [Perkinsus marinus ATCC 50983]
MSTRPGPVDEDSSSCLSGEGEGAVSQEDYVKLRNMINKQIIDPLQEADHHHQQGSSQGSARPTAVTYKNLISLLLPSAQEYHTLKKRKQLQRDGEEAEWTVIDRLASGGGQQ